MNGSLFRGPLTPAAYAVAAPSVWLLQHLVVTAVYFGAGRAPPLDSEFWLLPVRTLAHLPGLPEPALAAGFLFSLAVAGALAALSFRRAAWSGRFFFLAPLVMAPVVQIPAVALLALTPRRSGPRPAVPEAGARRAASVIQGVLAGFTLVVLGVFASTLVFHVYGWGLFVLTPFMVGLTTAYLANRAAPLSSDASLGLVMSAAGLGGLALLLFALEGLVCIFLAAPLGAAMAAVGGVIGRRLALADYRGGRPTLMSVAALPLVFAAEAALPPAVPLQTLERIEIAAPPSAVWRALTRMDAILPEPGPAFQLGLAYPVRAEIFGEGVGAERRGVFSTGVARERVTEWAPDRKLTFAVLSNPPMMRELSPYRRVHAPHGEGYFETAWTSFELEALPGGRTRVTERAAHTLKLDPVLYWAPLARWAIDQNNRRVLTSLRLRSEALVTAPGRRRGVSAGRP